jgi:hypothetical protein
MISLGQDPTGGKMLNARGLPRLSRCSPAGRRTQGRANASALGVQLKKSAYLMLWHSKTQRQSEREHSVASTAAWTTGKDYCYKLSQTG